MGDVPIYYNGRGRDDLATLSTTWTHSLTSASAAYRTHAGSTTAWFDPGQGSIGRRTLVTGEAPHDMPPKVKAALLQVRVPALLNS